MIPKYSCTDDGLPVCTYGYHVIDKNSYFYTVNPKGGYGMDEVLICDKCLPENPEVKQRLIECGVLKN